MSPFQPKPKKSPVDWNDSRRGHLEKHRRLQFTTNNNIHLICDQICSATVFGKPDYSSITKIVDKDWKSGNNSLNQDLGGYPVPEIQHRRAVRVDGSPGPAIVSTRT
ncbi:unnamed protein product [Linum tenue]|uniref:Uncharacterized protein n=1 Tax=Linum tenue TaxID=586396 RepID=A0AAV0Q2K5_9ROSI|nr:unnamed protein product [Linum tenue]